MPRDRSVCTLACVAGFCHMCVSIAGQTITGARAASTVVASRSSANPWASRATTCAVAGAMTMRSACCPIATCPAARSSSWPNISSSTGRYVSAWKVSGRTNSAAERVMTTCTVAPACVRWRASSTALYAAIEPDTPRTMNRPRVRSSVISGAFPETCVGSRPGTPRPRSRGAREGVHPQMHDRARGRRRRRARPCRADGTTTPFRSRPLSQQLFCDDHALHLARAFVDAEDARVAVGALDRGALHVAHPAVDLQHAVRDPAGHLGRVHLHHRGLERRPPALVQPPRRVADHETRRMDLDRGVREHPLDRLVRREGAPELRPALRMRDPELEEVRARADGARRERDASDLERAERRPKARADLAEDVLGRHLAVLEDQLARRRPAETHLLVDATDAEAGRSLLDDERADAAARTFRAIRDGVHDDHVRDRTVRHPDLGPVEDPAVADPARRHPDRGRVRAAAGLGDGERRELPPRGEVRKVAPLLLLVAAEIDGHRADRRVCADEVGEGRRCPTELLECDAIAEVAGRRAAVLLRKRQPEESELSHLAHEGIRDPIVELDLALNRADLLLDELADRPSQALELLRDVEVDAPMLVGATPRRGGWRRSRGSAARNGRVRNRRRAAAARAPRPSGTAAASAAGSDRPQGRHRARSRGAARRDRSRNGRARGTAGRAGARARGSPRGLLAAARA